MSMQRLSVEQVATLTALYESQKDEYIFDGSEVKEMTNADRLDDIIQKYKWEIDNSDKILEELQYWGYIDENLDVTVPGRQYLKTGPDSMTDVITKNYNITLFEKVAEIKGIEVNFSALSSTFNSIANIFKFRKN